MSNPTTESIGKPHSPSAAVFLGGILCAMVVSVVGLVLCSRYLENGQRRRDRQPVWAERAQFNKEQQAPRPPKLLEQWTDPRLPAYGGEWEKIQPVSAVLLAHEDQDEMAASCNTWPIAYPTSLMAFSHGLRGPYVSATPSSMDGYIASDESGGVSQRSVGVPINTQQHIQISFIIAMPHETRYPACSGSMDGEWAVGTCPAQML